MDLLKREMEKKRQALEAAKAANGVTSSSRFLKANDLRRLQDQVEEKDKQTQAASRKRERNDKSNNKEQDSLTPAKKLSKSSSTAPQHESKPVSDAHQKGDPAIQTQTAASASNYTAQELTTKLRQLGLPVRLFGEDDDGSTSRLERLQDALKLQHQQLASMTEQNEFRLGHGHGIRNPFLERDDDVQKNERKPKDEAKQQAVEHEQEDVSNDPNKRIHRYFKGLLQQWEDDLVHRSEDEKRTVAGRNETKTYKQCKDYIRPLFKLCKKRQLEESIIMHLVKIIDFCEQEEFVKANDAYMDLAIGRAAWPIGVTMVGIHARSGREKIASGNVAHVMNSELQRKYLTSVKRLMTFAQKKSDVEPSKKVSM